MTLTRIGPDELAAVLNTTQARGAIGQVLWEQYRVRSRDGDVIDRIIRAIVEVVAEDAAGKGAPAGSHLREPKPLRSQTAPAERTRDTGAADPHRHHDERGPR